MNSRTLLRQHNLRPRKSLGQHFLVNEDILRSIVGAAHLAADDTVIEVGPGMGALTTLMAPQAGRILAVELDATLAEKLRQITAPLANVHIVQNDILRVNLQEEMHRLAPAAAHPPYKVVANLPYYITTPILRYFFRQPHRPSLIVVTIQQEVARRMVASPPGNFLAVLVQFYAAAEIVRLVPAGAFYPPPKVGSAVVRLALHEPPLEPALAEQFLRIVSMGFSQPRKQLHNPLVHGTGRTRDEIIAILTASGISEGRRAETLTLDEWLRLAHFLSRA